MAFRLRPGLRSQVVARPRSSRKRILFASYGSFDFSMISPLFPLLRQRGYEFAIMNRYDHAPTARQLKGLTVFQPPDVSAALLGPREIEQAFHEFLDTQSIRGVIPLWRGRIPGLTYLRGWSDRYFDFAIETLNRYEPALV